MLLRLVVFSALPPSPFTLKFSLCDTIASMPPKTQTARMRRPINNKCTRQLPKQDCLVLGGCPVHRPTQAQVDSNRLRTRSQSAQPLVPTVLPTSSTQTSSSSESAAPVASSPSIPEHTNSEQPTDQHVPPTEQPSLNIDPVLSVSASTQPVEGNAAVTTPSPKTPQLDQPAPAPSRLLVQPTASTSATSTPRTPARTGPFANPRFSSQLTQCFTEKHVREQKEQEERRQREAMLIERQRAEEQRVYIHVWRSVSSQILSRNYSRSYMMYLG